MDIKRVFAEGLIIGVGANLLATSISGHARENGYGNKHIFGLSLLVIALFVLIWTSERS